MKYQILLILQVFLLGINNLYSQDSSKKNLPKEEQIRRIKQIEESERKAKDSIGISIEKKQFDCLINKYSAVSRLSIYKLSYEDFIVIVRLLNTVTFKRMTIQKKYKQFYDVFSKYYLRELLLLNLMLKLIKECVIIRKNIIYI